MTLIPNIHWPWQDDKPRPLAHARGSSMATRCPARLVASWHLSPIPNCHNEAMRKKIAGVWVGLLVLAASAVAQAQTVTPGKWTPWQLKFTQDGKRLMASFSSSSQNGVASWDVENGRLLSQNIIPKAGKNSIAYFSLSPDGSLLANATAFNDDIMPTIHNIKTGQRVSTLETLHESVSLPRFSADDKLASGWSTKSVKNMFVPPLRDVITNRIWSTSTGKLISLYESSGPDELFDKTLFPADNSVVVRMGVNKNAQKQERRWIVVFDRTTGERLASSFLKDESIYGYELFEDDDFQDYALSPDGHTLCGSPFKRAETPEQLPLWNTRTGELINSLTLPTDTAGYLSPRFSTAGSQLTIIGTNKNHKYWKQVWETASGKKLSETSLPFGVLSASTNWVNPPPTPHDYSTQHFARFTNEGSIELFSLESGEKVREIEVELRF